MHGLVNPSPTSNVQPINLSGGQWYVLLFLHDEAWFFFLHILSLSLLRHEIALIVARYVRQRHPSTHFGHLIDMMNVYSMGILVALVDYLGPSNNILLLFKMLFVVLFAMLVSPKPFVSLLVYPIRCRTDIITTTPIMPSICMFT